MNDDEQWREKLTPEEYYVCREKGTEAPFSGAYCDNKRSGDYLCKCCGESLFRSEPNSIRPRDGHPSINPCLSR